MAQVVLIIHDALLLSYLGLGLMAARHEVFSTENPRNKTEVQSSCLYPSVANKKWNYAGISYSVR